LATGRALTGLIAGRTATESYFASHRLKQQIKEWTRHIDFDAVLAFSSSMAPLALQVPAARHVLDMDDLDSHKWAETAAGTRGLMKKIYRMEARRLAHRENEWMAAFDATILISQREAQLVDDPGLKSRIHIIEGVSTPTVDRRNERNVQEKPIPADPIVGFIGAMDYGPNIDAACWFHQEIWPLIRQVHNSAEWWIVGRSPGRAIRRLDNDHSVRVTGSVPDMDPYLRHMRVSVAPLRLARGVQIKVLTAMAAGIPCVVTPCVAEGITGLTGNELYIAESPAEFADAVLRLLRDDRHAAALSNAAYEFIHHRYRPEKGLHRLEALLSPAHHTPVADQPENNFGVKQAIGNKPSEQLITEEYDAGELVPGGSL
jgi:sugar transferase (PEP-CTERM/EpsH1 system associated)